MGLGLGISVDWASLVPYYARVASAFKARVEADGGTVESMSCLKKDLKVLNPVKPPAYTGLLNDYSGAAAAYSLRLLDNTYTGDAIVVRRASDNTTQAIGFVNNELDTATLESFCTGTDGFVTTWYDQSGNGNDAAQASASSQPKIVSSGSTILDNSKPSVQFDDTSRKALETTASFNNTSLSSMSVINVDATSGNKYRYVYAIGATAAGGYSGLSTLAGGTLADWVKDDALVFGNGFGSTQYPRIISNGLIYTNGNQYLNFITLSNSNTNFYLNSSAISTRVLQNGNTVYNGILYIGGDSSISNYFSGKIQELVFYTSDESSNRTGIETNINDFYTIY